MYAFLLSGKMTIGGQTLEARDGLGIWDVEKFDLKADDSAEILLMEVPMTV